MYSNKEISFYFVYIYIEKKTVRSNQSCILNIAASKKNDETLLCVLSTKMCANMHKY